MNTDVVIDEKIKIDIEEPKKYKVIMLNDDSTPMDWVIEILEKIFKHSLSTAQKIMLEIHNNGSAVAGVYSYELAEQKVIETTTASRNQGFPLQLQLESE